MYISVQHSHTSVGALLRTLQNVSVSDLKSQQSLPELERQCFAQQAQAYDHEADAGVMNSHLQESGDLDLQHEDETFQKNQHRFPAWSYGRAPAGPIEKEDEQEDTGHETADPANGCTPRPSRESRTCPPCLQDVRSVPARARQQKSCSGKVTREGKECTPVDHEMDEVGTAHATSVAAVGGFEKGVKVIFYK